MDYNLYLVAELNYKKAHEELKDNLFPIEWYSSKNYKLKTELIVEALDKNVLVQELESYVDLFIKE